MAIGLFLLKCHAELSSLELQLQRLQQGLESQLFHYVPRYYRQIEDPIYLYLLVLPSTGGATADFDALEANLLNSLQDSTTSDSFDMQWRLEIDVDASDLPLQSNVLAISRLFIRSECMEEFEKTYHNVKYIVTDFPPNRGLAAGSAVGGPDQKQQWVIFSGWDNVAGHEAFIRSPGFAEFGQIRSFTESADFKHAKVVTSM